MKMSKPNNLKQVSAALPPGTCSVDTDIDTIQGVAKRLLNFVSLYVTHF